jgi:hypothetical protein
MLFRNRKYTILAVPVVDPGANMFDEKNRNQNMLLLEKTREQPCCFFRRTRKSSRSLSEEAREQTGCSLRT